MGHQARLRWARQEPKRREATARGQAMFCAGLRDTKTIAHLESLTEHHLLCAQQRALRDARNPFDPNHAVAMVTLGALATVIRHRQEAG